MLNSSNLCLSVHPITKTSFTGTTIIKDFFPVKSAYGLGIDLLQENQASSYIDYSKRWNKIWKFPIPNKIRIFLWRLSSNSLPTLTGLKKRNQTNYDLCSRCRRGREIGERLIFGCSKSLKIWKHPQLFPIIKDLNFGNSI